MSSTRGSPGGTRAASAFCVKLGPRSIYGTITANYESVLSILNQFNVAQGSVTRLAFYLTLLSRSPHCDLSSGWPFTVVAKPAFLAPKFKLLQRKQLSAWTRKGYANPGRVSF